MHQHHTNALNRARNNFKRAQSVLNASIQRHNSMREFMVVRDMVSQHHLYILMAAMREVQAAITDYQTQGEILVCVERMLEKA